MARIPSAVAIWLVAWSSPTRAIETVGAKPPSRVEHSRHLCKQLAGRLEGEREAAMKRRYSDDDAPGEQRGAFQVVWPAA